MYFETKPKFYFN